MTHHRLTLLPHWLRTGLATIACALLAANTHGAQAQPQGAKKAAPAAAASSAQPKAGKTAAEIAQGLWQKVLAAKALPLARRKALAEQTHDALNKKSFGAAEEGLFHAALGALHASDPETKYASIPLLVHGKKHWPELTSQREMERLWEVYEIMFADKTVLDEGVLAQVADMIDGPVMSQSQSSSFHFYRGLSAYQQKKSASAIASFSRVSIASPDYRRAKFLEALIHLDANRTDEARDALQVVIALDRTAAESGSRVDARSVQRLRELGVLNMARIFYERGQFLEALAYYRTLNQESHFFFESLSEQGWAFFMAGYPNRALGAVYAASSPFFAAKFNPDAYFLNAILYYWMCEFDRARAHIGRFVDHSRDEGDKLRKLVTAYNALPDADAHKRYAKVIEDAMANVSPSNIGLGPKTVATLVSTDLLDDTYDGLAKLTSLRLRLQKETSYVAGKERMLKAWQTYEEDVRLALGARARAQLSTLNADFERALGQSRLLYLEILMAKKDSVLGKERSVKGQEFVGEERAFDDAFRARTQTWAQDKNEFWYDELGSYVFQVKSQCQGQDGAAQGAQAPGGESGGAGGGGP